MKRSKYCTASAFALAYLLSLLTGTISQNTFCAYSSTISCGSCISYNLVPNASTDTANYSGANLSFVCTNCRDGVASGKPSIGSDVVNGVLRIDKSGCQSGTGSTTTFSPLVIALISIASVLGLYLLIAACCLCICCCCAKAKEPAGAAQHQSNPKKKKAKSGQTQDPRSKYATKNQDYMKSQIEGYEIKLDSKPDDIDLDDSNEIEEKHKEVELRNKKPQAMHQP